MRSKETKYQDLAGSISIDFPGTPEEATFIGYVESLGIDISRYHPIGLEVIVEEEPVFGKAKINIYALDRDKVDRNEVIINSKDSIENLFKQVYRLRIQVYTKSMKNQYFEHKP